MKQYTCEVKGMLDIKNWKVSIPLTMKVIGYIGENMTNKIVFYLEDLNFKDFSFFLDAEFSNKSTFSKLLDKEKEKFLSYLIF